MPYLQISDFKRGMDRTRPRANGVPGALWKAEGCVISRGGDIIKAKAFDALYTLPSGTFGLARVRNQLMVFSTASVSVPAGVVLQQVTAPNSANMERVLDVKTPDNKAYLIAKFDDGNIYHFFDGTRVTDWDALALANASHASVAAYLADELSNDDAVRVDASGDEIVLRAKVPGVAFTLTAAATNGAGTNDQTATVSTVTANVAEVANVDATGTVTITGGTSSIENLNGVSQISVDGTDLMSSAAFVSTSASATANLVASRINNLTSTHGYSATVDGAEITISAPVNTGTTHNGEVIAVTKTGDLTFTKTDLSGGVDYVAPVAQVSKVAFAGTIDGDDLYSVTLNGTTYQVTMQGSAYGTEAIVHNSRIYVAAYDVLRYSQVADFDDFTDADASSGAGFVSISGASGSQRIVGLGKYQDRIAVFTRDDTSTFFLEADATTNEQDQYIDNTGTVAPGSIIPYGNTDVFYLDETGVRSLRARDSSNAAFVSDPGSIIDEYVADLRASRTLAEVRDARAVMEPVDGRYWLAIGNEIISYSQFPSSKIAAWTILKPGFVPTEFVRSAREVFARSGDTIYVYGGLADDSYVAASGCVIETAFMDAQTPGTHKQFTGFDIACEGLWKFEVLTDPADPTVAVEFARISGSTLNRQHVTYSFQAAIFAIRATCLSEGEASLSQILVHYNKVDAR